MAVTKQQVLDLLKGFTVGGTIGVLLWLGSDELGSIEKMVEQYQSGKGEEISFLVEEHQNDISQANTTIENYKQALSQANGNIEEMTRLYEELLKEFGGFVEDTNEGYDEIYAQANETLAEAQETFNEQRNEVQKANEEVVATHQKVEGLIESDDYTVEFVYGKDENGNDIITDTTVTFNKELDKAYRDEMIGQNVTEVKEQDLQVSTNKYLTGGDKVTNSGQQNGTDNGTSNGTEQNGQQNYTVQHEVQGRTDGSSGQDVVLSLIDTQENLLGTVRISDMTGQVVVTTVDENEQINTYSADKGHNVPTMEQALAEDFDWTQFDYMAEILAH